MRQHYEYKVFQRKYFSPDSEPRNTSILNVLQVDDDYESAFADLVREINESVQKDVINEATEIVNRGD